MSYLPQSDDNIVVDLLRRKEFAWLKRWNTDNKTSKTIVDSIIPRFMLENAISRGMNLRLSNVCT
jgi:hypothetical protein